MPVLEHGYCPQCTRKPSEREDCSTLTAKEIASIVPECNGSSSSPRLWSQKCPRPQLMCEGISARTDPDFSLSVSRLELPGMLTVAA